LARKISDIFEKIYAKIENVVLWTRSVRRRIAVNSCYALLEKWNFGIPGWSDCDQYYLDTGPSFRHTLPAKKVLFKSQNPEDKALKPTTESRNFTNTKNILNFLLRASFVFVFS
jgi:hypothetical protein